MNRLQRELLAVAGESASITKASTNDWSSITFEGQKHSLTLLFTDWQEADAFEQSIKDEKVDINLPMGTMCAAITHEGSEDIPGTPHVTMKVEVVTLKE